MPHKSILVPRIHFLSGSSGSRSTPCYLPVCLSLYAPFVSAHEGGYGKLKFYFDRSVRTSQCRVKRTLRFDTWSGTLEPTNARGVSIGTA